MTEPSLDGVSGPHGGQPVTTAGADLDEARAAVVLVHGRGASPHSVLGMAEEFGTDHVAYLAPAAAQNTWYPRSFMEPLAENQPWLDSALDAVGALVDDAAAAVGAERVALLGFSQGACLSSEFVARNARRYGGLIAFSGGLIGPEGTAREYDGSLDGTPVFLGCSDVDPHIPLERVHETRDVLDDLGADVDERIYEGMGHTVNRDELGAAKGVVTSLESER
ncbi:alpha/beta hydrolase [Halobaculum sp. D14]|uniref:alpha/beta hydrolase n=1 Tax=Halobaculum sp. D14 TaxID=3421642 RepID=UPI003EB8A19A